MNPIVVIEVAALAVVLWLLATQVILPASRGTKLFPLFTTKEPKLRDELAAARQEREEATLKSRIAAERAIEEAAKPTEGKQ